MTKIWIDDLRDKPLGYDKWVKTSKQAISLLRAASEYSQRLEEISFDHDLGGEDTTRPVLLWMIENNVWPEVLRVHSGNPVGARWLTQMMRQYAPDGVRVVSWVM
jgi:hypothetical protein